MVVQEVVASMCQLSPTSVNDTVPGSEDLFSARHRNSEAIAIQKRSMTRSDPVSCDDLRFWAGQAAPRRRAEDLLSLDDEC